MDEDIYLLEVDLKETEGIDDDDFVRVVDNTYGLSQSAKVSTVASHIIDSYVDSGLNAFSTLQNPGSVEKTVLNALNSLLGHFEYRVLSGTTNKSGDFQVTSNGTTGIYTLPVNEIFLGAVAVSSNNLVRAYAYTPSASSQTSQYIKITNAAVAGANSKNVTLKMLVFKITV